MKQPVEPRPGAVIDVDIEKPAAGGRMLARHDGQVVLVMAAIPGERVRARVERVAKGVLFAETTEVLRPSPDRRADPGSWRCGGNLFAHVAYPRQLELKAQIVQDALTRIGRVPLSHPPEIVPSREDGYRMRARLHVRNGRVGFYLEGSHEICDAAPTGQLSSAMVAWIGDMAPIVGGERDVAAIDVAENLPATERACCLAPREGGDIRRVVRLQKGLGLPESLSDTLRLGDGATLTLRRDARAFFQGNRYLVEPLAAYVAALVPEDPLVDLYAGVGLFGLAAAAAGTRRITLVEGDAVSGVDLERNAHALGGNIRVERRSVEDYLRHAEPSSAATVIVDPPRTGMTPTVVEGLLRLRPRRLVYVSCDVATFGRDTRSLLQAGYTLGGLRGFDLFPNTAHVETVGLFMAGG